MLGILVLIMFAIVETAFLLGLAIPEPKIRRWTDPVGIVGALILFYGLYIAFNGYGVNTTAVVVLLLSLVLLIVATELQMHHIDTVNPVALIGQMFAVGLLIPSFWFAVNGIDAVGSEAKVITISGFFAYEALTVVYLTLANKQTARGITMILLVMSVAVFGLGLGAMLEAVGAL